MGRFQAAIACLGKYICFVIKRNIPVDYVENSMEEGRGKRHKASEEGRQGGVETHRT